MVCETNSSACRSDINLIKGGCSTATTASAVSEFARAWLYASDSSSTLRRALLPPQSPLIKIPGMQTDVL